MKAVFLDRDGVVNELVYHQDSGVIDSPFTVAQFQLLPGVTTAINKFHEMDFAVIIVSNQPGIAKGNLTPRAFNAIREKMTKDLAGDEAYIDGEYYCMHHPDARDENFKIVCECRKPKPGLILQAAKERNIDLSQSWMIGDNLTDVQAGKNAGTRTMLVGRQKCELCNLMDELDARPYVIVKNLIEASDYLAKISNGGN